jgi:pyrimidine deaminase RibD-like protein
MTSRTPCNSTGTTPPCIKKPISSRDKKYQESWTKNQEPELVETPRLVSSRNSDLGSSRMYKTYRKLSRFFI